MKRLFLLACLLATTANAYADADDFPGGCFVQYGNSWCYTYKLTIAACRYFEDGDSGLRDAFGGAVANLCGEALAAEARANRRTEVIKQLRKKCGSKCRGIK